MAMAALNSAGVSPREWIPAENIKFMHEHAAELEQMQKELAALSKGMS